MNTNSTFGDLILACSDECELTLELNGEVSVQIGEQSVRLGPTTLLVLFAFRAPIAVRKATSDIAQSLPGLIAIDEVLETIARLAAIGVLRPPGRQKTISDRFYPFGFYDNPGVHIRILNDRRRRDAFLSAVRQTVREGDVVLDLGSGSGILGIAAANAGARHVLAVEPSGIAGNLEAIAAANGVADKVQVISDWSFLTEFAEPADVLLFDIVGSEPLEMKVIETIIDALRRHLKTDARIVPQGLSLDLVAGTAPGEITERYQYSPYHFARWKDWYGIDFSAMASGVQGFLPVYAEPQSLDAFHHLTAPTELWRISFNKAQEAQRFRSEAQAEVIEKGTVNALIGIPTIILAEGVEFRADPRVPGDDPHWMTPIWLASEAFAVEQGSQLSMSYNYLGRGRNDVWCVPSEAFQ